MNSKKPVKKSYYIFLIAGWALIAAILFRPASTALAQNASGWSYPQTIPSFDLESIPPILVPDQNGNVHAFSSQYLETEENGKIRLIVYNKWNLETGWTPPIDILLSPIQEARMTDAYLDDEEYIHLTFWGGNGTDADIFYTKAPVAEAGDARAWSKPYIIGDDAGEPAGAVFSQTAQGKLVVIFNGRKYGNGLYVISSDDGGNSWSYPVPIFIADANAPNIAYLHAIDSETGWLHIIWNTYDISGQGRAIYYSRSPDGETWDQPIVFAEAQEGLGTQTPTIIEYDEELIALYNLPPKIIMQRSLDDGGTWQDPVILFPRHVGVNGALAPVVDSNNTLHLFFGQRISGNPDIHGMWHSTWKNNRWVEPEAIIKGPQVNDLIGYKSFDPYGARAVVSQGNVLLVTWMTDPGNPGNGVWFSYEVLNVPAQPIALSMTESRGLIPGTPTTRPGLDTQNLLATEAPEESGTELVENPGRTGSWNPGTLMIVSFVIGAIIVTILIKRSRQNPD